MAGITAVGVGSGLDLEALITDILNAERTPVKTRLDQQEAQTSATISALGNLKSTLADFQTALGKLKDPSRFNTRTATSSNSELFTATTTSGADLGNYAIEVVQLAKTQKLASGNFASADSVVGHGTLTIGVGDKAFNVDIVAGENDTVAGLRDAINNASGNTGVRASLLTVSDGAGGTATKLVLTADKPGSEGAITVSVGDNADAGLSQLRYDAADPAFDPEHPDHNPNGMAVASPAQDAIITIDGFTVTSSTNTFADAINGVTITALKEPSGDSAGPAQLSITENKAGIKSAVEGFVASYNALMGVMNQLTDYDAATQRRGLLSGDSSVSLIESRLRSVLGSTVEGAPSDFNSLAFLGVSTNRDGTISLDGDKLDKALENRYEDVSALFSGDNGVAGKLDKTIGGLLASGGLFANREESLQKQLDRIDEQREAFSLRLEKIETRYRAQFAALDMLVSQLNSTGNFLTQQLEASAQLINRNNNR